MDEAHRHSIVYTGPVPDPRVEEKIHRIHNGCWLWLGSTNTNGYGHFVRRQAQPGSTKTKQVKRYVHRYTYEHYIGPIPDNHDIHHVCENRVCCNPAHLQATDHSTNIHYALTNIRRANKRRVRDGPG